jgi:CSLREA domain-containing protein
MPHRRLRIPLVALGLSAVVLCSQVTAGAVAPRAVPPLWSITATTTEDQFDAIPNGQCSLREAVHSANTRVDFGGCVHSGSDPRIGTAITLPGGTYRLTRPGSGDSAGSLDVHANVGISPQGFDRAVIDGDNADSVIEVGSDGSLGLLRLTIRNGNTTGTGGGIRSIGGGPIDIQNTTITGNSAESGGGIGLVDPTNVVLVDVTISGNRAAGDGGGIYMDGGITWLRIGRATIADNAADSDADGDGDGGGIRLVSGTVFPANSIVAGNRDVSGSGTVAPDCSGAIVSSGANLIGSVDGCGYSSGLADLVERDPLVAPLADNGGPTPTHALLAGSPAVDAGNYGTDIRRPWPEFDQRYLDVVGQPDIGAYERVLCRGVAINRFGTPRRDLLIGTTGRDGFLATGGHDRMRGLAGADAFCAGTGNNLIKGGSGNDLILGEFGKDKLIGGKGRDTLRGGPDNDRLIGGPGRDKLRGGPGKDVRKQ